MILKQKNLFIISWYALLLCFSILFPVADAVILLEDLYTFGLENGDTELVQRDKWLMQSDMVEIPPFNFFNKTETKVFVNINGVLSLGGHIDYSHHTCDKINLTESLIAPFWAHASVAGSHVFYSNATNNETLLAKATRDISKVYPDLRDSLTLKWLFIATWQNMTPFVRKEAKCKKSHLLRNTFQIVLASDGVLSFVLFLYNSITWTTGICEQSAGDCKGLSGNPARTGFYHGNQSDFVELDGSCSNHAVSIGLKTNSKEPGKFVFRVDSEEAFQETPKLSLFVEPSVIDLFGGDVISIRGPSISETSKIKCIFSDPLNGPVEMNGWVNQSNSSLLAQCPTPLFYDIGELNFTLQVADTDDSKFREFSGKVYVDQLRSMEAQMLLMRSSKEFNDPIVSVDIIWNSSSPALQNSSAVDLIMWYLTDNSKTWHVMAVLGTAIGNEGYYRAFLHFTDENDIILMVAIYQHKNGTEDDRYEPFDKEAVVCPLVRCHPGQCSFLNKNSDSKTADKINGKRLFSQLNSRCAEMPKYDETWLSSKQWYYSKTLAQEDQRFFQKRCPSKKSAVAFGDPHFYTFDSFYFHFICCGDFWLVRPNSTFEEHIFSIQARLLPMSNSSSGTYVAAVAVKIHHLRKSSIVVVEHMPLSEQLKIQIDGEDLAQASATAVPFSWYYPGFALFVSESNRHVLVLSPKMSVLIRRAGNTLTVLPSVSEEIFGTPLTFEGVFREFDSSQVGSLVGSDGTKIALSVKSNEYAHLKKWEVSKHEGLFSTEAKSAAIELVPFSYADAPQEARNLCGSSVSCLLDYATTGNADQARITRLEEADYLRRRKSSLTSNSEKCPSLEDPMNGVLAMTTGFLIGSAVILSCYPGYEAIGPNASICLYDRSWSSILAKCEKIEKFNPSSNSELSLWYQYQTLTIIASSILLIAFLLILSLCITFFCFVLPQRRQRQRRLKQQELIMAANSNSHSRSRSQSATILIRTQEPTSRNSTIKFIPSREEESPLV